MKKTIWVLVLSSVAIFGAACSGSKEAGEATGGTTAAKPSEPVDVAYGAGIYDLEKGSAGSWRWVSEKGTIKLRNSSTDMHLKLSGSSPIDLIGSDTEISIKLNGEELERVKLTKEKNAIDKDFAIPVGKQAGATSELTIESTKFFVPKQVYKNSGDDRKLSFSLTKLEWAPAK
jgi:hypothetical protein